MIRVYAFKWVPPFAQGLVRDLRVRWALGEAGLDYEQVLIDHAHKDAADYLCLQPFGQVPAYEEDGLQLFESGAIVLHIGERSEALLPREEGARARTIQWMFAALNSIEPHVQQIALMEGFYRDQEWAKLRREDARALAVRRLDQLSARLGDEDYLDGGRFTAADLLMTTVLRIARATDLVAGQPTLAAYVERCEARPAFRKALADQLAPFAENAPPATS
jgi:glutathione S-transferase